MQIFIKVFEYVLKSLKTLLLENNSIIMQKKKKKKKHAHTKNVTKFDQTTDSLTEKY